MAENSDKEDTKQSEDGDLLKTSGLGQLMSILGGHLELMKTKEAHVDNVIASSHSSELLQQAKQKALQNEKELLLTIMNDIGEMTNFLNDIILIENLFNNKYSNLKKEQETARNKCAQDILKYELKEKPKNEVSSFVELVFGGQTHISSLQTWLDKLIGQCHKENINILHNSGACCKKIERAFYKSFYVYVNENENENEEGYNNMTDVMRCSLVFNNFDDIYKTFSIIQLMADESVGGILRIKDRFHPETIPFGYRDLMVNIYCPGSKIVCELQLHHTLFYDMKKISHKMYKRARLFERENKNLAYEYATKYMRPKIGKLKVYQMKGSDKNDDDNDSDQKQENVKFDALLKMWGLQKYIKTFEEEGWDDVDDWHELTDDDLKTMKLATGHLKKFWRKYKQWKATTDQQESKENEEETTVSHINVNRLRYGFNYAIHWDKNRFFEGKFQTSDGINYEFVAHDGDKRTVKKKDVYQLDVYANVDDLCISYYTARHKYLNPGKVSKIDDNNQRIYVKFDDGDEGWMQSDWVHKKVNIRYGFNYAIQWDKNSFFEGTYKSSDNVNFEFVAHDGDKRTVKKNDVYKLGVKANVGDLCISYYTAKHKYLNPGKVSKIDDKYNTVYVKFDDGDEGWMQGHWVHKKVNI